MTLSEIWQVAQDALIQEGWLPSDSSSIAVKPVQTFRGEDKIIAWLYLNERPLEQEPNHLLCAQFYSEGRNVCENCNVLLPKTATAGEVRTLVSSFAKTAQELVDDSFAVRMLRAKA